MAQPPRPPPPPPPLPPPPNQSYWCYSCDKRVLIETEGVRIVCRECKNVFVESMSFGSVQQGGVSRDVMDLVYDPSFAWQCWHALNLIAQASRDGGFVDDEVQIGDGDDGWRNDDEEDEEEFQDGEEGDDDEYEGLGVGVVEGEEREEEYARRRRDALRLRVRDIASRINSGRNRIVDLFEILMGLEENLNELHVELPEMDGYFANPEDYVDAAGYEALLQNFAESDQSGRRGAPAAAKSAVAELPTVLVNDDGYEACSICRDGVNVGDSIKNLPCGHGYHEDCIVPWLGSRNSCPVCRYELRTDDPEYEEERKKKLSDSGTSESGLL